MSAGHDAWSALAGQELTAIDADGAEHRIRLAAAPPAREANGWLSYTLSFRAGPEFPAEQQTYRVIGPGVDEPVFVVPVARDDDGLTLEAVFAQVPQDDQAPQSAQASDQDNEED
jgi:hypothetical protein